MGHDLGLGQLYDVHFWIKRYPPPVKHIYYNTYENNLAWVFQMSLSTKKLFFRDFWSPDQLEVNF